MNGREHDIIRNELEMLAEHCIGTQDHIEVTDPHVSHVIDEVMKRIGREIRRAEDGCER